MADGTRVTEPPATDPDIANIDTHEVDFGGGDVRDRQRVSLAGLTANSDVAVAAAEPDPAAVGLVVRQAGSVSAMFADENGVPFSEGNPLPVSVGDLTVQQLTVAFPASEISTHNTFSTPLAANELHTGDWEEVAKYAAITAIVLTDQYSAVNGAVVQFSDDGVTALRSVAATIPPNQGLTFMFGPEARYFRILYTNGATAQTIFRTQVVLHYQTPTSPQLPLAATTTDVSLAQSTQAHLKGRQTSGVYIPIRADSTGRLQVTDDAVVSGNDLDNQFTAPQAANAVFTGAWKQVERHGNLIVLYATQPTSEAPASVAVEYSDDQSTVIATSALSRKDVVSGPLTYAVYLLIANGGYQGAYARLKVTNGPVAQTQNPIVYFARNAFPFVGSFGALDAPLTFFSQGLLTRAVQAGLTPDGSFVNVAAQGRHAGNSSTTPLNGNTGGTDHIFRGTWVEWSANYGGMFLNLFTDVAGTLYVDFSEAAAPDPLTDVDVQLSQTVSVVGGALYRRSFTTQSRWVRLRYVNGVNAQTTFGLGATFIPETVNPGSPIGEAPSSGVPFAVQTKAVTLLKRAEDLTSYDHQTATLFGTKRAADVNVVNLEEGVLLKPLPNLITEQADVNGSAVTALPTVPLTSRSTVRFTNPHATVDCYYSESAAKVANRQGDVLMARSSIDLDLTEGSTLYWTLAAAGGTSTTYNRNGTATSGVTAVTNPDNVLLSDDVRAIMTGATSALSITGYTTPSTGTALSDVRLCLEVRRDPTAPTTLTVSHVDTVTGIGGNATSVVSGTVTADSTSTTRYLVAVSYRNTAAVVSSVTGLGATWASIEGGTGFGSTERLSLWYNTTPVTATGAVTAFFSASATDAVIGVSRFTNVDPATFDNHETILSASNTSTFSDTIDGTALGMAYVAVSAKERTTTFGNSFVEQADLNNGGAGGAGLAVGTLALAATGTQAYSGTLSGTTGWVVSAVTLKPAPYVPPQVRVRYSIGGVFGMTALSQTVTTTADTTYEASVFGDRAWVFADIAAMTVVVDQPVWGGVNAQIDWVGVKTIETTGADVVRLCMAQVGGVTA